MGNASSSSSSPEKNQNKEEDDPPLPPPRPPVAAPQQQSHNNQTLPQNFTCEICIEPMLFPNKLFKNGRKCAHPFCRECMIKYIQVKLQDNIAKIPCPALDCSQFLDPFICRELVGPELFVRWCDALCETALMGFSRSYCPNRNCSALIVNECGGNVKKAICPNCKRPFCFHCKLPWHSGFRCEESGEPRDRNDRAFGVLAERNKWKRCPQCHHFVELIDGCRIVKCRCSTRFCYTCGGKVNFRGCGCEIARAEDQFNVILLLLLLAFLSPFVWLLLTFTRHGTYKCRASFCYKCGRQVHQHWCGCDATSECCTWFFQMFIVLLLGFSIMILFRIAQSHM